MNLRTLTTASVVCMGVLVTGCGGDSPGASDAAPSTPRDQLLLSGSDLPADAKPVNLPVERLREQLTDFAGVQANSTIDPQECRAPQLDLEAASKQALDEAAVTAVVAETAIFIEFVSGRGIDTHEFAQTEARCAELTVSSEFEGERVDSRVRTESRTPPAALAGIDAIASYSTSTASVRDVPPTTTVSYAGWASLRGTTVAVRVTSLGDTLDEAKAEQFFADAVRKVEDAP
ncbi:hypothetical protein [Nocardia otitidiscaviarum]|nr:hypothetical protein [Nocardia otitidiscaviarum]MBF6235873.1 hypothetical protein [Nocardia otitidiscaviarum]